jgi:hypothetical protein
MVRETPRNKRSVYISIKNLHGTNLIEKSQTIQIMCTMYNSNTCVYILYICMYKNYTHYMSHVDNYAQDITHTHTYVFNVYVCTYITYTTYTSYISYARKYMQKWYLKYLYVLLVSMYVYMRPTQHTHITFHMLRNTHASHNLVVHTYVSNIYVCIYNTYTTQID